MKSQLEQIGLLTEGATLRTVTDFTSKALCILSSLFKLIKL